jgi:riboflavin biosynthesis pyrimidine reductase
MLAAGLVRKQHLLYAPIVLGLEGVPSVGAAMTVESGEWSVVRREILGDDTLLELEDRRATDALREVA